MGKVSRSIALRVSDISNLPNSHHNNTYKPIIKDLRISTELTHNRHNQLCSLLLSPQCLVLLLERNCDQHNTKLKVRELGRHLHNTMHLHTIVWPSLML
jgi:hypothetical protein